MLGNEQFYNRTIRKVVVAFGTMFNDIVVVRTDKDGVAKERFKVPLAYGPKEKYLTRITSDPTMTKSILTTVPRISFNLDGLNYDSSRKQVSTLQNFNTVGNTTSSQYVPTPYNFDFSLSIFVRNHEDGSQILEQILPFFTPDFTVTVDINPNQNLKYDMPIILNSVTSTVDYEGDMLSTRLIMWDLQFTVKGFIWPPSKQITAGLIGAPYIDGNGNTQYGFVQTNFYLQTASRNGQKVTVDYANGTNYFADSETVILENRNVTGRIVYFSNNSTGIVVLDNLTDLLKTGDIIKGDFSGAKYTVSSIDLAPQKVFTIITTPVPQNALPDDDYGFAEEYIEWPDTLL